MNEMENQADQANRANRRDRIKLAGLGALIVLILVWGLASTRLSRIVLPSPLEVGEAFWGMADSGAMLRHISATLYRVSLSFSASLGLSLALGYMASRSRYMQGSFEMMVMFLQSVPSAIWIVLAIIWFGISDLSPIFVVGAIAFPIMALNIFEGVKNVSRDLVEMGEIFGHTEQSLFRNIVLPSIFPYILTGSRVTMAMAWKVSVIAEVLGATSGIGYAISQAWQRLRTDEIFAWSIVIILVLQAFDQLLFRRLEKRVRKYQAPA